MTGWMGGCVIAREGGMGWGRWEFLSHILIHSKQWGKEGEWGRGVVGLWLGGRTSGLADGVF